ncbi:hypothetical protein OHA59_05595 [Streptomyces sp. NBC_01589]|uniref:hypothetical protein n=1 Tax=Streptomyces sp. NBC_01589 TaxID=2975886 RepID=UPI003868A050
MRRFILPIAAILLTAACGGSAGHATSASAHATSRPPTNSKSSPAAHAHSGPKAARPKPSRSAKKCSPTRDVIVWTKGRGVPDNAAVVGNYNLVTCETTFQLLQHTSPTEAGDCTEAAWSSDNPGYHADAVPAARLKKVQVAIGPDC